MAWSISSQVFAAEGVFTSGVLYLPKSAGPAWQGEVGRLHWVAVGSWGRQCIAAKLADR